ncbi:MAG: phytanoyl-CoA dioxygenase family protein [Parvibaculum sp.]|nr:phytanoyl-CoA dioxygenase family protein [Parvibaculum sp.]
MQKDFSSAVFDNSNGAGTPKAFGDEISMLPPREIFRSDQRDERLFGGELGCRQGPRLRDDEVTRIRELIKERLVYNAGNLNRKEVDLISNCSLDQYHTVSSHFDHQKMLCKAGRILSKEAVEEIRSMSIFDYFKEGLGSFDLADEDNVGHEQVCFRVVRPNMKEDVGSLHCDSWFWDYYNWPTPAGQNRLKVWVPICVDAGKNGLIAVPGSHTEDRLYQTKLAGHKIAFEPGFDISNLDYRLFDRPAGTTFLFNYFMLHVGAANISATTRVSIEFTVLY